jgi:predicted NBD/HSP70 family sugar kinase
LTGSAKLLRAMNSSATLAHLLQAGRLTRAELRERTGLSKPTSSEMLRLLTDAGLAVVAGRTTGGVGPTAEIYAPNGDAAYALAVSVRDTAGTRRPSLATALCDLGGAMRDRAESAVDFSAGSAADAVAGAVRDVCRRARIDPDRVRHVQVGVAGSYDARTDTIHHIDIPGWDRPGILAGLRARLDPHGSTMVAVENDVKLAAIAERHRGVAAGAESFCLLWLGSGVGLATDLGGTLLRGTRGGAGEIGYLPAGPAPASRSGTGPVDLQDLVSGSAVLALAKQRARRRAGVTTLSEAFAVEGVVEGLAERIAFVMATIVAVLDPPLVVLAGEVAQAGGTALRDAVAAALDPRAPTTFPGLIDRDVQIATTAVDDDAVLLGGLDAGLAALRESLISSLAQPSTD